MPRTPPLWSVVFLFSAILLASAGVSLAWYHASAALDLPPALSRKATFVVVEGLGILLPAWALARLLEADPRATFPLRRVGLRTALAALAGTLGLSILLTYLQDLYQQVFHLPYPEALMEILAIHTPVEGLLLVMGVVLAAAVCEEAVFRGYVQSALQERLKPAPAIALTALAFAAFHLEPAGLPTYLLLGAWLGWLRYTGVSLVLPILAHAANNTLALLQVNWLGETFWAAHGAVALPLGLILAIGGAYGVRTSLAEERSRP
jgi:membrane protease YdiL (CAAX protease family)